MMPIEFRCNYCERLLRAPDDMTGGKVQCPNCAAVFTIPDQSSSAGDSSLTQPTPSQVPVEGTDQTKVTFAEDQKFNPYTAPKGFSGESQSPFDGSSRLRDGPPWERDGKSLATYWATVKEIFQTPIDSFGQMRRNGGLADPMWYGLLGGLIGTYAVSLYQFGFPIFLLRISGEVGASDGILPVGILIAVLIVLVPLGIILHLFISSCITHVALMLVGGARQPFETTFRVVVYTAGTASLILIMPICGSYVQWIVQLVYTILGLKAAHEISGFKASMAVFLPSLICCGLVALMIASLLTAGIWFAMPWDL